MSKLTLAQQLALAEDLDRHISRVPPNVLAILKQKLRGLGDNMEDEVEQFRVLHIVAREFPSVNRAVINAGLGDVSLMDPTHITPEAGELVQVFNTLIEKFWHDFNTATFRKVVYTRDDLKPV